jgi:hypothetical protein
VSYAAKISPIKRADNPAYGRQVDCLDGKFAYEFKMRVSPAASGQGRFKEELEFARDCRLSPPGYIPVLLVLDSTLSTRLTDLSAEFSNNGGEVYIGNEAWRHIELKAGTVMGKFVEKYVRTPLLVVQRQADYFSPIQLSVTTSGIAVTIGSKGFSIARSSRATDYEGAESSDLMDE